MNRIGTCPLPISLGRSAQLPDAYGSQFMVDQENAHQHHQTAQDGHPQVSFRGPKGSLILLLGNPDVGRKGHDLKENECCIEIRR